MDCSPPGSTVHGILQARILEWVAKPSTRASFQPRNWTVISCVGGYIFCTHTHTHTHIYIHTHTYTYLGEGNVKPPHILVWRIPLTKEPGGLQSKGSQRTEHYSVTTKEHIHIHIYIWSRFLLRWNKQECLVSDFSFYFCFIIELLLIYNVLSVCWRTVLWFTYMYT